MSIIRLHKHNDNYVVLNKSFLEDKNISLKLKGFLAYCLSKPDNWHFHVNQLTSVLKEGREAITSAIDEGIEFGYIEREQKKAADGRFLSTDYVIYEVSIKKVLPQTGNPIAENVVTENPKLLKNNGNKNDRSNDLKNGTVRECGNVDKLSSSRSGAAENKNRSVFQSTQTVSEQKPVDRSNFDPFSYRLKNGSPLDLRTARSFAKYEGNEKVRLIRNILWYEKQIEKGITPNTTHEKMLQWAIKNDMSSKESYLFQNELYAKFLLANNSIPGMQILKTVVRITSKDKRDSESISLDLPPQSFAEVLKKYMVK
jgi:hypothetical protein